jgi:hypothetical protein
MSGQLGKTSGDLIAVAAIIVGFGLTVIMFRAQREIWVQDQRPDWPNWLAWSDYLIIVSVLLASFAALIPLLAISTAEKTIQAVASASLVAALILQVGYIPAILAHYRIEIGRTRTGPREKGEPAERRIVVCGLLGAAAGFAMVLEHLTR